MKFLAIAFLSLLVSGAIANPAPGGKKCDKYEYAPGVCKKCPPDGGYKGPRDIEELDEHDVDDFEERDVDDLEERDVEELDERDLDDLEVRGYPYPNPRVCKIKCPKYKKQCKKWKWTKGKTTYKGWFKNEIDCRKGKDYKVYGKIQPCDYDKKKQCLVVTYKDYSDDKKGYLGIYDKKWQGPDNKWKLNYNQYCRGDRCFVPVEKLPGYPKLCKDTLWIGVDASRCKKNYGGWPWDKKKGKDYKDDNKDDTPGHGGDYKKDDDVDYVPLRISCDNKKGKKYCAKYCCCPGRKHYKPD